MTVKPYLHMMVRRIILWTMRGHLYSLKKAVNGIIIFIIIKAMFQQDITSVLIYTVRKRVRLFIN